MRKTDDLNGYQNGLRGKSILDVGYCKKLSQPLCLEADRQAGRQSIVWSRLYFVRPDKNNKTRAKRQRQGQVADRQAVVKRRL